jgi:uroporphyrin-III C-methyltransferase/precorrin-2 dehydrogenase/sirohydrochlorin ferrochelatase
MRYFPIFIDLEHRDAVVVGGGEEALRKVRLLLKTTANIKIIAPELHDELAVQSRVNWIARRFEPHLLEGAAIVFSADKGLNAIVSQEALARGIPVNAVDQADISTFIVPSIVDRDPVVVAIGTEGTAPVMAQGIRARIEGLLPFNLGALANAARTLRGRVAETIPAGNRRRAFWQRFFFGDVRHAFLSGDLAGFSSGVEETIRTEAKAPAGAVARFAVHPTDPELLTLKAHRQLQEADVIVHEAAISRSVLEVARRDAVRIPYERASRYENLDPAETLIARELDAGHLVVHLTSGDAAGEADEEYQHFPIRNDLRDAVLRAAS